MHELIIIVERDGQQTVSARDLYEFLEIKTAFTHWCNRMFEYGFEQGQDFVPFLTESSGGRPATDYALTLDCAKEISMLQRSEKGKQARQYFITCERKLQRAKNALQQYADDPIIGVRLAQLEMDKRITRLEAKTTTRPDYFTIAGYATLHRKQVGNKKAAMLGRKAAALCRERGYDMEEVPDPRFGIVKSYPAQVLEDVFAQYF